MTALTSRQQRFVSEYLIDLNACAAYRRCGYRGTEAAVRANSARLMAKDSIARLISERQAEIRRATQITAERVVEALARIAFADPRKLSHADGTPKRLNELDADTASAVVSVTATEAGTHYRLADRVAALDKLMRHLGLYPDGKKQANTIDFAAELVAARERMLRMRNEQSKTLER